MPHSRIVSRVLAFAAFAACAPVIAQEGAALDTITVTGSNITYRDLLDTPAVSVTRPGDFLLLPITLVNDTRSEDSRKREIYATIQKMMGATGKRYDLIYDDSYPLLLTTQNYQIPLGKDEKRPDVNKVSLSVRTAIDGKPGEAQELTRALRAFVEKAERVGRTEIDISKETALSLSRPERYRYDLIKAIADDTTKVRAQLGESCKVTVEGLSSRIEWRRVSAAELLLFIPYHMTIQDCGNDGTGKAIPNP